MQGVVLALVGRKWLRLDVRDLLLASNAAVGGPATAAVGLCMYVCVRVSA